MSRSLYYLSSPYTNYCQGREAAFVAACEASANLMKQGMLIYSPIAHSHPIAVHGRIDQTDHKFWMPFAIDMLDESLGLIVLMMPGWRESDGVAAEIARARETEKPICYLSWPMLNTREDVEGHPIQKPD